MFPESQNTIEVNDGGRIITKNVPIGTISHNNITIQKKYDVAINNLPEEKYHNNPELYFFINANLPFQMAVSENGYVRFFQSSYSASKLVIENKKMVLYPTYSGKNVDLLGNTLVKSPILSTHHDAIKIDENYLYLTVSKFGYHDGMILSDSKGNEIKTYSFGQLIQKALDLTKYSEDEEIFKQIVFGEDINNIYIDNTGQQKFVDWAHINSLVYDSFEDILYASLRHRGVLAIDYSEWSLIWWIADNNLKNNIGAGIDGQVPYDKHFKDLKSLEPYRVKGDVLDDGPKHQHSLFLLANGNLAMFDNAGYNGNPLGSRYVEYEIKGTYGNYTAQKIDEYRDSSLYSSIMSDVDFTGDNYQNLLICYGFPTATILEIEKNSKSVLFKLNLPFQTYRADKLPLYYDEGRVYSEDCNLKNPN